jgi:flagellar basal body-associated protein FliL
VRIRRKRIVIIIIIIVVVIIIHIRAGALAAGDETELGEKGVNIAGGEQSRCESESSSTSSSISSSSGDRPAVIRPWR